MGTTNLFFMCYLILRYYATLYQYWGKKYLFSHNFNNFINFEERKRCER